MSSEQKRIERIYLDEARAASPVFPNGEPVPHEPLDFLFPRASGTLGIEMPELCRQTERGEGARLGYVAPKAKKIYTAKPDAMPVSVSPVFSRDAHELGVGTLACGLADFVYAPRDELGRSFTGYDGDTFPKGFCHIGIFEPLEWEPQGEWRYFRGFDTPLAPKALIDARIAEKNGRVEAYRRVASEVWLLIVNDRFLGPGEVCVRADHLAQWHFEHAFDKVLLFERQAGGSGQVIELL